MARPMALDHRMPEMTATQSRHSRHPEDQNAPVAPRQRVGYFLLGCILFAAYAIQSAAGLHWPWLAELQTTDFYKQISGFCLLVFIDHQWHLSVLRSRGLMRKAGGLLRSHKLVGALAPLFLYAHAQTLGYAYQQMISAIFFGIFLSGLFNQEISRIRGRWFHALWLMGHAGLSMALLVLLAYHVFVTYAYQ